MSKYYCQYLSPEGCVLNSWNLQTQSPAFPPPHDKKTQHYPEDPQIIVCLLMMRLGQSLVCPFWLQSGWLLNRDLETHADNLKRVCQTEGRSFFFFLVCFCDVARCYTLSCLEKFNHPSVWNWVPPLSNPTILHSTFGKWYSCSLILQAKSKKMHPFFKLNIHS